MRLLTNPEPSAQPEKPNRRGLKIALIVIGSIFALLLILVISFFLIRANGKRLLMNHTVSVSAPSELVDAAEDDGTKITYNGQDYNYNENVVSILFMGIDKKDIAADTNYGSNGQADSLFVAAMDTVTGAVKIIPISREAMVDVNCYSVSGAYVGVEKMQLCLAYAYGATGAESSENVVRSVSRLLYGVQINSYITIDLDGVKALTNAVGGVRVNALETLEGFTEGRDVTLKGDNAIRYIQMRGQDVEANNRRMARQKQFLSAFATTAGNQIMANFTRLAGYYNTAAPYIVSDLSFSEVTYLASCCLTNDMGKALQYQSIAGQTVMGEEYVEFYPDSTSLYETVLNAFYTPVEAQQ